MKKIAILMMLAALLFAGCANDGDSSNDAGGNTNNTNGNSGNNSSSNSTGNGNDDTNTQYTLSFDKNTPQDTSDYYWFAAQNYAEEIQGSNYNPNASDSFPSNVTATSEQEIILPIISYYFYKVDKVTSSIIDYDNQNRAAYEWHFIHWNTKADGTGTSYNAGDKIKLTDNLTLYAIYQNPDDSSDSDTNILDISTTTTFSMKVGESVTLKPSWNHGDNCYYSITSNTNNAISISGKTLTANAIGTAIVKMTANDNPSAAGDCVISVTEEGFEGSVIENMLIGTWKCSGSSYSATIVFNSNMTGHITATLSSSTVHDNDFTWSAFEGTSSKYFQLSGTNVSSLDGQHTLTSITSTRFVMSGYLAFGFPSTTTWTKQ